jgi:hypothetical protein
MMAMRRILALALMLTTLSAPLALAVCHVECAEAKSTQHSCHESSEPAAVSITAVPHFCGHADEAPTGIERAPQAMAAPVAVLPFVEWTPSPSIVGRTAAIDIQRSPPGSYQLVSQLRV